MIIPFDEEFLQYDPIQIPFVKLVPELAGFLIQLEIRRVEKHLVIRMPQRRSDHMHDDRH